MELFKPYRLIEETDAFVVYEFRTGFLYLLYGILLTIGVGYFTQQNPISCTGIGLTVLYLCTVTTQYCNLSKKISQSAAGTYKYRGSLGGCNRLRHRVHAACAEFRVVFVLADRFFPAPATAALSPFGLSDRIGGGLSACVFGEF